MAQTTIPDKSVEKLTRGEGSADLGVTPGVDRAEKLADLDGTTMRLNGCAASAYAALYADVDVITAYPIRPYTAIMMNLSQFIADEIGRAHV